jgi:hypothetical protein
MPAAPAGIGSAVLARLPHAIVGRVLPFAVALGRCAALGGRRLAPDRPRLGRDGGYALVLPADSAGDRLGRALGHAPDERAGVTRRVLILARPAGPWRRRTIRGLLLASHVVLSVATRRTVSPRRHLPDNQAWHPANALVACLEAGRTCA